MGKSSCCCRAQWSLWVSPKDSLLTSFEKRKRQQTDLKNNEWRCVENWTQMSSCCACACNHLPEDSPFVQMDKKYRVKLFFCVSLFFNLFSWLSFYTANFPAWKQVFWIPIMQPGRHTIHELVCQLFSDQKAFSKWARSTTIVWTAGDWENWNFILWHLLSCYETWLGMEWGIWGLTRKAFVRLSGRYYIIAPFSPHQVVKV